VECDCKKKKLILQRKPSCSAVGIAPPIVHEVLRTPGQPLDAQARSFFEPRFGLDLSEVRVHTDQRAAQSARAVDALAYTVGNNLVFDSGRYDPGSREGQRLLAHELAHSVQQRSTSARLLSRQAAEPGVCDPKNLGILGPMFRKSESDVKAEAKKQHLVSRTLRDDQDLAFYCPHRASIKLGHLIPGSVVYVKGRGKAKGKDEVWAQIKGKDDYYWGFIKSENEEEAAPPEEAPPEKTGSWAEKAFDAADAHHWDEAAEAAKHLEPSALRAFIQALKRENPEKVAQLHHGAVRNPKVGPDSSVAKETQATTQDLGFEAQATQGH